MKMDIREIIKRLEEIETEARDEREYGLEDSIGRLIEDIIEDDLEVNKQMAQDIRKYVDDKIENEIVARAIRNGTIAKA
jgi:hypothetical protein